MSYELAYRDEGADVRRLQEFLVGIGHDLSPDGLFGPNTRAALIAFQKKLGLQQSGNVDVATFDALAAQGMPLLGPPFGGAQPGSTWPPKPAGLGQPNAAATAKLFGTFKFVYAPTAANPERIQIEESWERDNIVTTLIPQLDNCLFAAGNHFAVRRVGAIQCHRLAAASFQALFAKWQQAGLMDRVLTCSGVYNARLIRGQTEPKVKNLSNHSWGTAIDINARENPRKQIPVGLGARGCVRELVEIANGLGFYWGGHFGTPDGMHFELAAI